MKKPELVALVAESLSLPKTQVEKTLDAITDAITVTLKAGEEVRISGFGAFEVRLTEGRKMRNPRTKEIYEVPATRRAKFSPFKDLADAVR